MTRIWTIIGVRDVRSSFTWYQSLFGHAATDPAHDHFALRPLILEAHDVESTFPRLTRSSVPAGVEDANYSIVLPRPGRILWRGDL